MSYDEMLRILKIGPWQLDARIKELQGLVKLSADGFYSLTEKGRIAYQIMKDVRKFNPDEEVAIKASFIRRTLATFFDFIFFFTIPAIFINSAEAALVTVAAVLVIWTFMEAQVGRTPGKFVFGTRVIEESGVKLGLKGSLIRNLGKFFIPLDVLLGLIFHRNEGYLRYTDYKARSTVLYEKNL
jgi:hypothetical protein